MSHRENIFFIAAFTLLVWVVFVPSKRLQAAAPRAVGVTIDNFSFTPPTLSVKVGTQITWTNRDDVPHTVVSEEWPLRSKTLDTDETFTFTPTKPGTYTYFCSIHPKMTGKVVVQ